MDDLDEIMEKRDALEQSLEKCLELVRERKTDRSVRLLIYTLQSILSDVVRLRIDVDSIEEKVKRRR